MSIKHVREYYDNICKDYHEMMEALREAEEDAQNNLVTPESVENLNTLVKPMKDNYERWSYMMFLLNMPNKKEKKRAYLKQNRKKIELIEENNNMEAMHKENTDSINEVRQAFK